MGRPLRYHPPDASVEITHRTIDGELLLRPSKELNERIEAIIARAQRLYPVVLLHAYIFLSNHYHMIATAPDGDVLASFLKHINRNIALAARAVNGGVGPVWAGRVKIRVILDPLAAVQRLYYVCSNGVKEGLVAAPTDWPGASSARALLLQCEIVTTWLTAADRRAVARGEIRSGEHNVLRLTPLPVHAGKSSEERQSLFERMFATIAEEGRRIRGARPPMGRDAILRQDPTTRWPLDRRQGPVAHSSLPALRRQFFAEYCAFCDAYRTASSRLACGELDVAFPPGSFPPRRPFVPWPATPGLIPRSAAPLPLLRSS